MTLEQKIAAAVERPPNAYAALFEVRLLLSPKRVQREWLRAGYRFSFER